MYTSEMRLDADPGKAVLERYAHIEDEEERTAAINADPEAFDPELVTTMIDMSGLLTEYKELLESDQEFSEEDLNSMIEWFATVDELMAEIKAEYGI